MARKQFKTSPFKREALPTPAKYYSEQFSDLKIKGEWVQVHCPFHEDQKPSLSINMVQGHFKCHACGEKGCDIIAFHQKRYGFDFVTTVKALGAWR